MTKSRKLAGGAPDASQKTPPAVPEQQHGSQNSADAQGVKRKIWILEEKPIERPRAARKAQALHMPPWIEAAREWPEVTAERFTEVRHLVLRLTVDQCAELLQVTSRSVLRWEAGRVAIPFAAFMALRLLAEVRFLPHQVKAWKGWRIIEAGPDVGMLYDEAKSGALVTPEEVRALPWIKGELRSWQEIAEQAKVRAAKLEAENSRLRRLIQQQGVTRELRKMQERIDALLKSVATADLIELPAPRAVTRAKARVA